MNKLLPKTVKKPSLNSLNVRIYHNPRFSLDDVIDVLHSVFYPYSSYKNIVQQTNNANHIFCACDEAENRCIAAALVNYTNAPGGLYLLLFGVRKSSQHHGIGTRLLTAIIEWAYQTYHRFIYLHVYVKNYKAIGLYEKVGFRRDGYIRDFYKQTPKDEPHAYRMTLLLWR